MGISLMRLYIQIVLHVPSGLVSFLNSSLATTLKIEKLKDVMPWNYASNQSRKGGETYKPKSIFVLLTLFFFVQNPKC